MRIKTLKQTRWLLTGLMCVGFNACLARSADELTEEFHQTYPLAPDGRVSLANVNGSVHILAWDRAEVKIDAVKRAKKKEDLDAVKIEVDAKSDQVQVHTKHLNSSGWFGRHRGDSTSVEYTVMVPKMARLDGVDDVNGQVDIGGVEGKVKASSVNGPLKAEGLAADSELSTVNGQVSADFVTLKGVKSVSLSTVNGGVDVQFPADSNADLSASTVNGNIGGDVAARRSGFLGRELNTRIGSGGTDVHASSVNGGVTFRFAKAEQAR